MIFSTTKQERIILFVLATLLVLGALGLLLL
jgi:hypothetical protein